MEKNIITEETINKALNTVLKEFIGENSNVSVYDRVEAIQDSKSEIADKIQEMINKYNLTTEEIQEILSVMVKYFSKIR